MEIREAFSQERLVLDLREVETPAVVRATLHHAQALDLLDPRQRVEVETTLLAENASACTPIGHGVVVAHVHLDVIEKPLIMFARLSQPVNMDAPDGIAVRFFFFLIGNPEQAGRHLDTLMKIARLMSDSEFRSDGLVASTSEEMVRAYDGFLARVEAAIPTAPVEALEGLEFTGRFAGGIRDDVKRRLAHYASDFKDGIHPKVLASTLFLFVAHLAPTVAFGGLTAVLTGGQIGVMETLIATAFGGFVYAFLAGQPLTIVGAVGPLVVFTGLLYQVSGSLGIPFLATYAWVGLWTGLFLVVLAVTDASALVRYVTRFTDEVFAVLISLIFIVEAVHALGLPFTRETVAWDAALLAVLLAAATYVVAVTLKGIRRGRYLYPVMREFLADFGPAIAIAVAVGLSLLFPREIPLERISLPESLGTSSGRPWLVNPFDAPVWVWFAAAGPALLNAALIFLNQSITSRLVNSPTNRIQKGPGYHLDLGVLGFLVAGSSVVGFPWIAAATVRSLNHVRSLATVESVTTGGDERERIVSVRENRVSAVAINLLLGLSLLALPVLAAIPLSVLYGLFLYMGFASLEGIQFVERLKLWIMDPALYPRAHYLRRVARKRVHLFTAIQAVCLAVLWFVKSSVIGILFPLFITALVPVRVLLKKIFTNEQLDSLDAEEEPVEETDRYR